MIVSFDRRGIRPLSKLALSGEIDDCSADFWPKRESHTQRVDDERGQKSAKKRDLNGRMEFRKRSITRETVRRSISRGGSVGLIVISFESLVWPAMAFAKKSDAEFSKDFHFV